MSKIIDKFDDSIKSLNIDIQDDTRWPIIFNCLTEKLPENERYTELTELLNYFFLKEKTLGHCHKGNIFWQIGVIKLLQGDLNAAISNIKLSKEEDLMKLKGEPKMTASIGLLSVIQPLLKKFKTNKGHWEFDISVNDLYETLNKEEKRQFADVLLKAHDNFSQGKIEIIKEESFTFVTNESNRKITRDTYKEVSSALILNTQSSYFSQIFALGSICEAMLDELFTRESEKIWQAFHNNLNITNWIYRNSKLKDHKYPYSTHLGEKIMVLRRMALENICPINRESVLLLLIICEYRDLIHPWRRINFEFEVNHYVASVLLSAVNQIAGDWWPKSIKKIEEKNNTR